MEGSVQMPALSLKIVAIILMISGLTKAQTAALTTASPGYDPCSNYTILNQPWRATNESWSTACDRDFEWNGWYRLLYYGMNIRMPEVCSSGCSTGIALWLNGAHPQIQDGIVTRQICGNNGGTCCYSYYSTTYIRVKACPGNFYVYEFIKPVSCDSAYCADITTLTPANFSTTGVITTETNITTDSRFDPCYNYTALDNYWRNTRTSYRGHDDTLVEWKGWYRLYLQGQSAQMSEWCVTYTTCGGVIPLLLRGSHPQTGDGIVTREVTGSHSYYSCNYYKSNSIQVKACPGNYYVYKLVKPDISIPVPSYCAVSFSNSSVDPCYSYTALNDTWRSSTGSTTTSQCDAYVNWVGWYRLFYQGQSAKMPESCVNLYRCGTTFPLWLNGSHPNLQDGVVIRQICGNDGSDCCYFKSLPIQVKACPGNYYVYEFVKTSFCNAAYCTDTSNITVTNAPTTTPQDTSTITVTNAPTTTPQATLTTASPGYDPCSNYTVLDQPWRATNASWSTACDQYFEWNGWYRLLYYGMNIRMPEVCSSGCSTGIPLWLNGSHPQIQDGIVTRQICGTNGGVCCYSYYSTTYIRVKACPGNFYVYEFIKPVYCNSAYCADITSLTPANFSTTGVITTETNITTDSRFDPCYNYTVLDNYWRNTRINYRGHDDTLVEWKGWYRLYLQGQSAQMSEWCVSYMTCGGVIPLLLRGSHPQIGDGIVTREVTGYHSYYSCNYYKSNPVQVKACPGNYYVYKLVKPDISIPVPSYCAVSFSNSSVDPCYSYTALNDTWRSSTGSTATSQCDAYVNWVGWYRLFYQGQSAKMPESCVNLYRCGTTFPLWLSGSHPNLQDGVVVRQICGSSGSDCCYFKSLPIQVKACPGNYYVYEFVKTSFCNAAYCTDTSNITVTNAPTTTPQDTSIITVTNAPTTTPQATLTTASPGYDPCSNYTVLDQPWRATNASWSTACDRDFEWNGWYRLLYYGMNIRMPESCSSGCSTGIALWLNGAHPQIQDGIVTRQICGTNGGACCYSYYSTTSIRVKACPGNFYVYEFIKPLYCYSAYCADISTLTPSNFSTTGVITTETNTTTDSSFDPCYNYTVLDNYWRNTRINYRGHDDTLVEWKGWYRLYLQGKNAQMSEWCVSFMSCGGVTPLLLRGSHPRIGDGIVTREVTGTRWLSTCNYYKSNSIQVKACPGNYYVYKLVKPDISIPVPSYCAVSFSNSSVDPCYSYTALNDTWRSSSDYTTTSHCDTSVNWVGWYRLFYQGQSAKMPESCVSSYRCGTQYPLWLNGSHPNLQDGVVVRQTCTSYGSDCCFYKAFPIQVKACPGNYYVYEFVKTSFCNAAYCTVPYRLFPILPGTVQRAVTVDGGSTLIQLDYPFFYFGKPHSQLYLSMNGFLSFEPLYPVSYDPSLNKDIIAPLWTKIHIYTRGSISYSQATSGPLVKLAADEISQGLPGSKVFVSWVFVSTWEKVEFEPDVGEVTFQVVLVSDSENRSYVLMNYGSIPPSPQVWMAGYKAENNTYNFTIEALNTSSLSSTTNVGIPGRWAFRVDGAVSAPSTFFFPMLPGAIQHAVTADGGSRLIQLDYPFFYFGKPHSQIYLSMDGFLSFEYLYPDGYDSTLNKDIIAPLWTDVDSYTRGNISYEQATNGSLIELATNEMNSMFSGLNFSVSWVFVATWEKMEFEPDTGEVTFQVILISDSKNRSYVLMNYGSIPPDPLPWMAGYKTVNNTYYFSIQAPSTSILSATTNVGILGRWAFRVDSAVSVSPPPALFYPFGSGAGDTVNPRSDDGSSPAVNLQSPFTFFRRTYTKLYVNNNGHLTFDQPWDSYTPTQFSAYNGRDIIAPLWTDIDNRATGNISYNQYTSGSVLSQATRDINQYFPEFIFTASYVFVATWDKVAYYSYSGTETSFQVVLISGGSLSFVLINYGDIAPTNYRVEAGYDTNFTDYFVILWSNDKSTIPNLKYLSNVNVPGRWAFMLNQPSDAFLAARLKVLTGSNLTDFNNQKIFLQQLQDELRRRGVTSTIKVKRVQKKSP
ncbi:uncharacterized protein LOC118809641 isoform X2 [Colossoma macropomum]|uniref:uncharacterized protein LOC118809641 isoform X2 n=1 Tax=Colossoma macropomum TaxID=42526 RepID=UPI001864302C|nr:uncharacterized protein LOC118809641 isoform X2 [Colossoma macropomum]